MEEALPRQRFPVPTEDAVRRYIKEKEEYQRSFPKMNPRALRALILHKKFQKKIRQAFRLLKRVWAKRCEHCSWPFMSPDDVNFLYTTDMALCDQCHEYLYNQY